MIENKFKIYSFYLLNFKNLMAPSLIRIFSNHSRRPKKHLKCDLACANRSNYDLKKLRRANYSSLKKYPWSFMTEILFYFFIKFTRIHQYLFNFMGDLDQIIFQIITRVAYGTLIEVILHVLLACFIALDTEANVLNIMNFNFIQLFLTFIILIFIFSFFYF